MTTSTRLASTAAVLAARLLVTAAVTFAGLADLADPAHAAGPVTRWVSPSGSGTACSEDVPCDLPTALGDGTVPVAAGDEVVVTPGAYTTGQLQTDVKLDVHGQTGEPVPTINLTDPSVGFYVYGGATLHDLAFSTTSAGAAISSPSGSLGPVLDRVTVHTTTLGGVACDFADSVTLRDSVCWGSGGNGDGIRVAVNTAATNSRTVTLRNVTAIGGNVGIDVDVTAPLAFHVDARSVIADGAGANDIDAEARGNAVVTVSLDHSSYATTVESGGTATVTPAGTGTNQLEPPTFVDAATGDFHEAAGSPTIDAGAVDASSGVLDLDGNARTVRGRAATSCPGLPDIGAYELVSPFDCAAPETSITGPTSTADNTPTFTLASTDAGSTFECAVDAGAFGPCTSPFTTPVLALGAHTVRARATDLGGNVDASPASASVTVVAPQTPPAAPETTITRQPRAKVITRHRLVAVRFEFSSPSAATFECTLDGAAFAPCTSPATVEVAKGRHTFRVRSRDVNGIYDPTPASVTFKVKPRHRAR
jgi:hypothetical protein